MSEDLDREAFRKWARGTFGGRAEQFEKLVDRVLGGTRRTRRLVTCPKCTHSWRVDISVGDDRLALELFRLLSEAGFGRPGSGEESASSGESYVFVNRVVLSGCPNCGCEDCGEPVGVSDGPGIWKRYDRRDRSEVTFLSYSDMLIYIQGMDEAERGDPE